MLIKIVDSIVLKAIKLSSAKFFTRSNDFLLLGWSHNFLSDD